VEVEIRGEFNLRLGSYGKVGPVRSAKAASNPSPPLEEFEHAYQATGETKSEINRRPKIAIAAEILENASFFQSL
jgi:hypothetical protein